MTQVQKLEEKRIRLLMHIEELENGIFYKFHLTSSMLSLITKNIH